MNPKRILFVLVLSAIGYAARAQSYAVGFRISDSLMRFSEVRLAAEDVTRLLYRSSRGIKPQLALQTDTTVFIEAQIDPSVAGKPTPKPYPVLPVPDHAYRWESRKGKDGKLVHTVHSPSPFGIACGLYGLLQDALGFAFYHPRETYIPNLSAKWPLTERFTMEVRPKFRKAGFHLHTMHPIELAEPLFNPQLPGALDEVKEYIDWLARNEQNVFDFSLMESVDRKTWIKHANAFTGYAKQRGILTSVDVSLHMIQQKSFQLYRNAPMSLRSKKAQIRKNLDWLFGAHWDIINMEFNSAEFLTGNAAKRDELRRFVQAETEKRGAKLMGRQHVVKEENDIAQIGKQTVNTDTDNGRGVLAHTVMFYSMTEPRAPVYKNENLRHIYDFMRRENRVRETWFYPETAYWVTFDSSVPIFPLPYLSSRLADIDTAAAYDVEGHLTFSSGWEMGYWLFDWSVARWSRRVTLNGRAVPESPAQFVYGKPFQRGTGKIVDSLLALHEHYLKGKNLIAYLTAQTVTDEIPKGLRTEFHPRPPFTYGWLRNKSDAEIRRALEKDVIVPLREFADKSATFTGKLADMDKTDHNPSDAELCQALRLTELRARHRAFVLEYLLSVSAHKESKDNPIKYALLDSAASVRQDAMWANHRLNIRFRYDKRRLTGKFPKGSSYTSYDFGYLYTAQTLHFWEREEEQARKNRYDFLFRNIWDVFRIVGLED